MKASVTDEFYNVGTGTRTTLKTLAEKVLALTESPLKVQYNPGGTTFVKNRVGSPDKAAKDLNFTSETQLDVGLRELITWRNSHKAEVKKRQLRVGIHE
jgi:UDP-glucose 4-epimerase